MRSLQHAQSGATDEALWSALRALQEKEVLLKALARRHADARDAPDSGRLQAEAEELAHHAETLRRLIESVPSAPE